MNLEELLSKNVDLPENVNPEQIEQTDVQPPKLEREEKTEETDVPKIERSEDKSGLIGESNDERYARHRLENAIKSGNSTAIDHAKDDYAKAKAKAMIK